MKHKLIMIFSCLIFINGTVDSQKKISFQFDGSILQSIGRDIIATYHSDDIPFTAEYFSQKKYYHPYANLLAEVSYNFNNAISAGVQTGIYLHFREKYFSSLEHTAIGIPLLATLNFQLFEFNSKGIGVGIAAGEIFERVDEYFFRQKNGFLFRFSAFYDLKRNSALRIGFEKQINKVAFTFEDDEIKDEFQYSLKRNSIFLSYEIRIGNNN